MSTLSYRKILEGTAEGTDYDIKFQLSGDRRPQIDLNRAHPYYWEFALQGSSDFPNVRKALVRMYFPSRLVRIAEYQPQTARKEKIAEISAELLPQLTITVPVFRSPPVVATDQMSGENHFVEWRFSGVRVDHKFRCLLKGVVVIHFYERRHRRGFPLKAYAMAEFRGKGVLPWRHESLTISCESEKINPRGLARKQLS